MYYKKFKRLISLMVRVGIIVVGIALFIAIVLEVNR